MQVIPIKTGRISPRDSLIDRILRSIQSSGVGLEDGDIVAIASKVVSVVEGRIVDLTSVQPSQKAQELATHYQIDPQFVEVILKEADEILGGVYRTLLTIKDDIMIANAGADLSNNPKGYITLWPKNPSGSADRIRKELEKRIRKKLIVLIIDSRTTPLRLGTSGIAIGISGINPIKDYRGRRDLFGKKLIVTTLAVADALASAAHLVMGEGDEAIPLAIIRNSEINVDRDHNPEIAKMPKERCLYMKVLQEYMKKSEGNKL